MPVVAISRKEADRHSTPLSISVSMEITPPDTATPPRASTGARSNRGLNRPTAITSGSTTRSFQKQVFTDTPLSWNSSAG